MDQAVELTVGQPGETSGAVRLQHRGVVGAVYRRRHEQLVKVVRLDNGAFHDISLLRFGDGSRSAGGHQMRDRADRHGIRRVDLLDGAPTDPPV